MFIVTCSGKFHDRGYQAWQLLQAGFECPVIPGARQGAPQQFDQRQVLMPYSEYRPDLMGSARLAPSGSFEAGSLKA